jgi:hypothetical protein
MINQEISRREHSLRLELCDDAQSGRRNPGRVHRIDHPSGSLSPKGICLIAQPDPKTGSHFSGLRLSKLLQTYTRQMEVLDKHRGKGQQKITVEHVTVEAGGQAIVGNISAAAAAKPAGDGAPPMLAHQPAEMMPLIKDITPAKAPVKARRTGPGPPDPE